MPYTLDDVRRWRQLAEELRLLAPEIATASGKAELLTEAEHLERRADEAEKALGKKD